MHIHKSLSEKREECLSLLRSTGRTDIEKLISHIEKMGYFIAPGSKKHHRFEGGLVSHSLETYHKAMDLRADAIEHGTDPILMPEQSVIITALMHDLCKADVLRYDKAQWNVITVKNSHGHSQRSVRQVGYSGFLLTAMEEDAILWHMGGKKFKEDRKVHFEAHPLSKIIFDADKKSIKEASLRHHHKKS